MKNKDLQLFMGLALLGGIDALSYNYGKKNGNLGLLARNKGNGGDDSNSTSSAIGSETARGCLRDATNKCKLKGCRGADRYGNCYGCK